jgi:hypothetical protein
MSDHDALTTNLKAHYGAAARKASRGLPVIEDTRADAVDPCCGPATAGNGERFGSGLYDRGEL